MSNREVERQFTAQVDQAIAQRAQQERRQQLAAEREQRLWGAVIAWNEGLETQGSLGNDRTHGALKTREVADVEAGVNDRLVAAADEKPHDDPAVAALQADRDRCAARGDFTRAEHLADRADALTAYLRRRELADVDRER